MKKLDKQAIIDIIKYSKEEEAEELIDKIGSKIPFIEIKYQSVKQVISEAQNFLIEQNVDMIEVKIIKIDTPENVELLIYNGFLPSDIFDVTNVHSNNSLNVFIDYFVDKMTPEAIEFWSEGARYIQGSLYILRSGEKWLYGNINGWKELAVKTCISLPLILYEKNLVYSSMRPKTDMLMFKQINYLKYKNKKQLNKYEYILDGKTKGLPVTRYSQGMSKGLYYTDKSTDQFCGTFYYYEPESSVFLSFKTSIIFKNKIKAMAYFFPEQGGLSDEKYEEYPEDMKITPLEYLGADAEEHDSEYLESLGDAKYYVGAKRFYAAEDIYDQPICIEARKRDIDVIILTHMVGSRQIVSEVLDTRTRQESFLSLVYPE